MELRHIRYFVATVDEGGVGKAADVLRVAQPSLSQALRKFEKELGVQLFHRVGRGLVLSSAGEALLGPARVILRDVEDAQNALSDIREVQRGRIDVAALTDVSTEPLSSWISQFRARHPHVTFRVSEHESVAAVVRMVQQGFSDIGIVPHPIEPDDSLMERFVVRQQFVVVLPGEDGDRPPGPVSVRTLEGVPLVMSEPSSTAAMHVTSYLRTHGVEPNIAVEVPHRGAIMPTVTRGGGAAIVPLRVGIEGLHHGLPVHELDPPLQRSLGVIHRPGHMSAAARDFLETAERHLNRWYRALETRQSEGHDLVRAAALTSEEIAEELRGRSGAATAAPDHP